MAWGGANEQRKDIEAGNTDAKDWCDEALKTVEKTVEQYWNDSKDLITGDNNQQCSHSNNNNSSCPLESEYDHHHCQLLEKTTMQVSCSRWKEELHRYLTDMSCDVSKDTDIIGWWVVCFFSVFLCTHKSTTRLIAKTIPLSCASQEMFVQSQPHLSPVSTCFPMVLKLPPIVDHTSVKIGSSNFKSSSILGKTKLLILHMPTHQTMKRWI